MLFAILKSIRLSYLIIYSDKRNIVMKHFAETIQALNHHTQGMAISLTNHAISRMAQRGIKLKDVELVLDYGREMYAKGAILYVLSKKEIEKHQKTEPKLKNLRGLKVVVSTHNYTVITAYRNKNRLIWK